jgi:4-amino-4-deoxy-L-arabinose transferase-like glycosyltransferase
MKAITIVKDIRFWIAFFFVIRLIGITNPPLEVGHNWRQTTVTMVARNFLEVDNNIFYPRVDFAGDKTGITGMEFPVLNYLIYATSKIFGYQHWYGRLINLTVSSFGLWFFYLLIRRFYKEEIALYSTLILSVSIWFQFSRKIMPDTFAMSIIMAGIYFGVLYLFNDKKQRKAIYLTCYFLFIMIGVLAKLPAGFLLGIMVLFLFSTTIEKQRKIGLVLVTTTALIPAFLWYFYWVPYLVNHFGFWHFFMGKDSLTGLSELFMNGHETLKKFYDTALKYVGFMVFLFGLFYAVKRKDKTLLFPFLICFLLFFVIMMKAGFTFSHHNYYIIPFVPLMALIAGYGVTCIPSRPWRIVILFAIIIEGIANQQHDFFLKEKQMSLLELESDLNEFTQPHELIAINSGDFPTPMYFAHRKGWILHNEDLKEERKLKELREKGLRCVVILNDNPVVLSHFSFLRLVCKNSHYSIYQF